MTRIMMARYAPAPSSPAQVRAAPRLRDLTARRDRAQEAAVPSMQPCQPHYRRGAITLFRGVVTPASRERSPGRWIRSGRKLGRGTRPRAP
jgi:hypothetical protein